MERRRPRNSPTRPLVLVVDGHVDTLALYSIALSAMGFDVIAASDAADAFSRAWQVHPDIIVTELALRRTDGWALLASLKDDPRTRAIPVVVLTGNSQPTTRERARREGCAAFFIKPCLPARLADELRSVLVANVSPVHASAPD
jgi:two-component system chemotaxis response regulator CheY